MYKIIFMKSATAIQKAGRHRIRTQRGQDVDVLVVEWLAHHRSRNRIESVPLGCKSADSSSVIFLVSA